MDRQREHHILMAHFAQINDFKIVMQVLVVSNEVIGDLPFPESEGGGIAFLKMLYGDDTVWVQTSYNNNFRYNYAGIDYIFNESIGPYGAFIAPQPDILWQLDPTTLQWNPPEEENK